MIIYYNVPRLDGPRQPGVEDLLARIEEEKGITLSSIG
jgi:hypothetical protein